MEAQHNTWLFELLIYTCLMVWGLIIFRTIAEYNRKRERKKLGLISVLILILIANAVVARSQSTFLSPFLFANLIYLGVVGFYFRTKRHYTDENLERIQTILHSRHQMERALLNSPALEGPDGENPYELVRELRAVSNADIDSLEMSIH